MSIQTYDWRMNWHALGALGHVVALLLCLLPGMWVVMDMSSHHTRLLGASAADVQRAAKVLVAGAAASSAASLVALAAEAMRAAS